MEVMVHVEGSYKWTSVETPRGTSGTADRPIRCEIDADRSFRVARHSSWNSTRFVFAPHIKARLPTSGCEQTRRNTDPVREAERHPVRRSSPSTPFLPQNLPSAKHTPLLRAYFPSHRDRVCTDLPRGPRREHLVRPGGGVRGEPGYSSPRRPSDGWCHGRAQ